jgi:hypothetical protein
MEKGGDSRPLFYCGRGRLTVSCRPSSSRPWLSSPLCSIPPFIWVSRVASSVAAAWHAHAIATARVLHSGHKEWLQQAILIPDVDYGCVICDVKHKVLPKVKKFDRDRSARDYFFCSREVIARRFVSASRANRDASYTRSRDARSTSVCHAAALARASCRYVS